MGFHTAGPYRTRDAMLLFLCVWSTSWDFELPLLKCNLKTLSVIKCKPLINYLTHFVIRSSLFFI